MSSWHDVGMSTSPTCPRCGSDTCPGRVNLYRCTCLIDGMGPTETHPLEDEDGAPYPVEVQLLVAAVPDLVVEIADALHAVTRVSV